MSSAIIQQWLGMQCRSIPGVRSGFITLAGSGAATQAVRWPTSEAPLPERLLKAAKTASEQRQAFVQIPKPTTNEDAGTVLALPLKVSGLQGSAAVLECDEMQPDQGRAAIESLIEQLPKLDQLLNPPTKTRLAVEMPTELIMHSLATGLAERSFDAAITSITTDLQMRFRCERVSFASWKDSMAQIEKVSGTAEIKKQQKIFRELENAMNEAADQMTLICYPPTETTKHRIAIEHKDYAISGQKCAIASLPLVAEEEIFGLLSFERDKNHPFTNSELIAIEHLSAFLAPLLRLKKDASASWYRRAFQACKSDTAGQNGKRNTLIATAVVTIVLIVFGSFFQVAFEITATAKIEGAVQRAITAPTNGYIDKVFVRPGDTVKEGDLLATLDDDDLQLERRRLESEISQYQSDYSAAMAKRDRAKMAVASAHMSESQAKLDLVLHQLSRLELRATLPGLVIDGDLTQALGSPVDKGQVLLTLAPEDDFRLNLGISENDIRYVETGHVGKLVLSSNPGKKLSFEITRITPMASIVDNQNVFKAEAQLLDQHKINLRPGLEGYAKIDAGSRGLLWVWARELRDWFSIQKWKWAGNI